MNPNSYTYGGITVQFNDTQKALLDADQAQINTLNLSIIEWDRQISVHEGTYNNAVAQYNSYCPTLPRAVYKFGVKIKDDEQGPCFDYWANVRDTAEANKNSVIAQKNLTLQEIVRAKQQLNDDLAVIQNAIKLQIQAQIANTTANTQGASNTAAINASSPAVLLEKQKQATEQAKLKQEQTIKIVGFILITVIVLTIGIFTIRKILA